MVNFLEILYVLAALNLIMLIVSLVRRRYHAARRFGLLAALSVITCAVLYWYLSPPR